MRAARLHEYTQDMSDGLSVEEIDRLEPDRSRDVVVSVEGAEQLERGEIDGRAVISP